jgi:hypothetical protein
VKRLILISVLATGLLTTGSSAQDEQSMAEVMKAMGALLGGNTNAAAVVDFRDLKALLPADLPGMRRTAASGERNGAMGMTVATAEGQYQGDDGAEITIKITDMGGTGALGGIMQYGWASMEVDKETETGFERSTTIAGHKAIEKYDTQDQGGETQVLVSKHFTVEVSGSNVTAEQIRAAVEKVDLAKLATLQPKPAE